LIRAIISDIFYPLFQIEPQTKSWN
jgi:hypothetical protein